MADSHFPTAVDQAETVLSTTPVPQPETIHNTTPVPQDTDITSNPLNNEDVAEWKGRVNDVLSRPGEVIEKAIDPKRHYYPHAEPWHTSLFGCCSPMSLCFVTWCMPCLTFGKTYHRIHKSEKLENYEPVTAACLLYGVAVWMGVYCIPITMQRMDVRQKYNLQGNYCYDACLACYCQQCTMVQMEKECEWRGNQKLNRPPVVTEQYRAPGPADGMTYPKQK